MAMNDWLAQMYNTNQEVPEEDTQKLAQAELFAKIASDHGVDLESLDADQVGELYAQVFPEEVKEAAIGGDAEAHWEEKRASEEKFAEADMMGRIMAHSFHNESEEIKEAAGLTELGMRARGALGTAGTALKDAASGKGLRTGYKALKEARTAGASTSRLKAIVKKHGVGAYVGKGKNMKGVSQIEKKWKGMQEAGAKGVMRRGALRTGALYGAGAAGVGGGAYAAGAGKSKKASAEAFEEISGNYAIEIAKEAGYDVDEAFDRINAVYTLGLGESEKVAHVSDFDDGVHVRALEYLDAASYDVNWDEVFGG